MRKLTLILAMGAAFLAAPALAASPVTINNAANTSSACVVSGALCVTLSGATSTAVPSTDGSTTVTLGGTYQTVFASSTSRKGCTIQNPTTATEILSVRTKSAIVWTIPIGGTFSCAVGGTPGAISDLVEVTATTTGHAFTAASQ